MSKNLSLNIIPATKNFQILEIHLNDNGLIEPADLRNLKLPIGLDYTKGVVISGKAPVWLFAFLSHELHIAKWVATFDPRVGAVVVQSHNISSPQKGDVIPPNKIIRYFSELKEVKKKISAPVKLRSKVICIVGPANSGKSVFIRELRKELNKKLNSKFRKDFYIVRACPDGEGDWFGDINAEEGRLYRAKKTFNDEFIAKIVSDIKNIKKTKKYILVDCGGKIDLKNQLIFNECTHALIVSNSMDKTNEWIGAVKASELKISAIIHSKQYDISNKTGENEYEIGKLYRENNKIQLPPDLINQIK
ncbi:MAG: CRISPR-associated protein Csx3 [Bacteroidetes bacterium]|nr:CRISPR-associated protein Csx3 [Bacteroidota bacterium]